jgi:hypothetical protein
LCIGSTEMSRIRLGRSRLAVVTAIIYGMMSLTGCGGSKILKKPIQLNLEKPLVSTSDDSITVSLDWVIVRDGPGTWAKNADWDEYLISVANNTDEDITIEGVVVVDSLGTELQTDYDRKQLVKASKKSVKRYRNSKLKVKAGWGPAGLITAGVAAGVLGAGVSVAAAYGAAMGSLLAGAGTSTAASTGALGVAAGGVCLGGPVLVGYGIVRSSNNRKVAKEIEARQTRLPSVLSPGSQDRFDLFFPLAPSPTHVRVTYEQGDKQRMVSLETGRMLSGLHIVQKEKD